ncbi:MAG: ribonuclease P protein component [Bacteroidales bacterium]|nr:ribonuclease P protein component [Bacteroidales bacterium]
MAPLGNTLSKAERLSGEKAVSELIAGGSWGSCGCLKYCWAERGTEGSRLMVSVPKRLFKRAVRRNLLKRRIREAYRIQKPAGIDILIQFNSPEPESFERIRSDVSTLLSRIDAARK